MLSFIAQAGYATAVINLTNELSSLLVGLIGLTAMSAAMIVVASARYRTAQKTQSVADTVSTTIEYQQAA